VETYQATSPNDKSYFNPKQDTSSHLPMPMVWFSYYIKQMMFKKKLATVKYVYPMGVWRILDSSLCLFGAVEFHKRPLSPCCYITLGAFSPKHTFRSCGRRWCTAHTLIGKIFHPRALATIPPSNPQGQKPQMRSLLTFYAWFYLSMVISSCNNISPVDVPYAC
jgi:hypothetical protein